MPGASPDEPAGTDGRRAGAEQPETGPPPSRRDARRVVVDPGGPVLVEGPVEIELPDGRTVRSDRFMVAVCACRRSRSYPWCDTSHRRRTSEARSSRGGAAPGQGREGRR
ncbi:CDGSH iron-sulfur domain-containing protein [Streptomyces sp. DSM 42041]|uniref:CDGSH iron-sulfur domain-containing protein n=1 Tax=Streptomyces hazeniae TaxID=3075538 RepID=A0ABU2NX25_9ACTN|nr:CDGSH iron-sulfur domain-containing protein [Streptomyces sp. DSM 42041]MDT0381552.1 CDGSH iron-sulfur domain-containing protein [Streptomyces sp. DSM 42041]